MCEAEEDYDLEAGWYDEHREYKHDPLIDLIQWYDLYVMRTGDLYGLSKLDRDDVETLLKIIEEARRV